MEVDSWVTAEDLGKVVAEHRCVQSPDVRDL